MNALEGIKRLVETAITTPSTHEFCLRIEIVLITPATVKEILIVILLTQQLSHLCDTVISQRIFQTFGHRLESRVLVVRQIAILLQQIHTAFIKHSRSLHGLKCSLLVINKAFQHHVSQCNCSWITHHTISLITHQVPDGEFPLLLKDMQERLSHVLLFLRMDQCHQRMGSTISIPE